MTGTDTGVGKTILAAAIVAALRSRGADVTALKPVITGIDESPGPIWPHDHVLLSQLSGRSPEEVSPLRYGPPASPALAAELSGRPIDPALLRATVLDAIGSGGPAVVEGVGGLLAPIAESYDVGALAVDIGLPLVVAARPGLGTVNHTLLTLEAARARGLEIASVVLTPWPRAPEWLERSNLQTIERLGRAPVSTLREVPAPDAELLAAAGAALPLERWLG